MRRFCSSPFVLTLLTGAVLLGLFASQVFQLRRELQHEIRRTIIERDAAVLHPVVHHQIAESTAQSLDDRLTAVLRSAGQRGLLAVALFDEQGRARRSLPADQMFVDLPVEDFLKLTADRRPISRFHPHLLLDEHFPGVAYPDTEVPVLEVILPLLNETDGRLLGVARYHLEARALAAELESLQRRVSRQTGTTLLIGSALIGAVVLAAGWGLQRAQRAIVERNERLLRTNFELTLAAKASAVGQITAHLLHGLQGPVAGLRATLSSVAAGEPAAASEWDAARSYTERLQGLVQETVQLLADASAQHAYELSGEELAAILSARNRGLANERQVALRVTSRFRGSLDAYRAGLVCLIGTNLLDNALRATCANGRVDADVVGTAAELILRVRDEGAGVPPALRAELFEPGRTGRPGGTGLGLAISRLLARQIGADLALRSTGPGGSVFELHVPLQHPQRPVG